MLLNNLDWKYGNYSLLDEDVQAYNTLYIDKASNQNEGLVLFHKEKAIGFMSITKIFGFLTKTFISNTGLLLNNESLYKDAMNSLETFVTAERIVIISQFDYIFKESGCLSSISSFFGKKQTIVNNIESDADSWLMQIKKKHRYYIRKALSYENNRCEVKIIDSIDPSFHDQMYDIYAENMKNKGAKLLFLTKIQFKNFINRNLNNLIITTCFIGDEISYFSIVHSNKNVANYIMAVTTQSGMSSYASYMGVYKLYDYLYNHKFEILNFGGVDPENNHGVYLFKRGFSGELIESPRHIIIGSGIIARISKVLMFLLYLLKSR